MKALLCKTLGLPDTLVYEDTPDPQPGPGQVVVEMKAAGVNFPDALIIQGKYQFKPALPFAPGAELAGVVLPPSPPPPQPPPPQPLLLPLLQPHPLQPELLQHHALVMKGQFFA